MLRVLVRMVLVGVAMVSTACATCASLFPQYYREYGSATLRTSNTVYYWWADTSTMIGGVPVVTRINTRDSSISQVRMLFLLESGLAVAGAAMGGLSTLALASWTFAGYSKRIATFCDCLSFLAFLCCGISMAVSAAVYCTVSFEMLHGDGTVALGFNQERFKLREGFALMAAATGCFLIQSMCVCFAKCKSRPSSAELQGERYDKG